MKHDEVVETRHFEKFIMIQRKLSMDEFNLLVITVYIYIYIYIYNIYIYIYVYIYTYVYVYVIYAYIGDLWICLKRTYK